MTRPSNPPDEFHLRPEFNHQIREEDFIKALVQITDAYSKTRAYRRAKKRRQKKLANKSSPPPTSPTPSQKGDLS